MCRVDSRELRFSRAMIFTIEEINNSTELLPGIKLGYQIHDSCSTVPLAMHVAFQLSNGLDPVFYSGDNCSQTGMVMAIVGESASTPSISMSRVIGSFNIPQVNIFWYLTNNVFDEGQFFLSLGWIISLLCYIRWATLLLVHASQISSSTLVSSEQYPVINSRLMHWPSW